MAKNHPDQKNLYVCPMGSYIVLDVWFASRQEENTTSLIVTILTTKVKRSETSSVLDVRIRLPLAQDLNGLTEAFPGSFVKGRVSMLEKMERF